MDPNLVLREYLELFQSDCRHLKLLVAPNAVLDFFGSWVQGPTKIHDFLRYNLNPRLDHLDFEKAETCEPIEQRPFHFKTKTLSKKNVDFVRPLNKVKGIKTLKTYADSDLDDDDLNMQPLPQGSHTSEHKADDVNVSGELTPPTSTSKCAGRVSTVDSDESDVDDEFQTSNPKRQKRSNSPAFSHLKRGPLNAPMTKVAKRQLLKSDFDRRLGGDTSSDEEMDVGLSDRVKEYTPLYYLEATGALRRKELPGTPTAESKSMRLRLSYRLRISDQQLQFALIIYEYLEETTGRGLSRRRNLMAEYNEAEATNDGTAAAHEIGTDGSQEISAMPVNVTETLIATDVESGLQEIEETNAFRMVPMRTPTKNLNTPPATPKRRPRMPYSVSRTNINHTPSTSMPPSKSAPPKRKAARSLRL